MKRSNRLTFADNAGVALSLFAFLFAAYLLTYSGAFHSSDELSMFSVTESMVKRGSLDTNQLLWMGEQQGSYGPDGNLYSRKGIGTSLTAALLFWVAEHVVPFGNVQTTLLLNSLLTALTGVLVYLFALRLDYQHGVALCSALVFAFATMAWVYTKYFFSEPMVGLGLLASGYGLLWFRDRPHLSQFVLAGAFLGLAVLARLTTLVTVPFFLGYLAWRLWQEAKMSSAGKWAWFTTRALWFVLPILVSVALVGLYNYRRFGDFWQSGYLPQERFSTPLWTGLYGLLASPGKGLFLYSPILVAALFSSPHFFRRQRPEALLLLAVCLSQIALYARWYLWWGGHGWGPRFLVPIIPLLVLVMLPYLEKAATSLVPRLLLALLGLLSVLVQIVGLSVSFNLYLDWLAWAGFRLYDQRLFFDPSFSPLFQQIHFLRLENLDFAWVALSGPGGQICVDYAALAAMTFGLFLSALALYAGVRRGYRKEVRLATTAVALLLLGIISAFSLSRFQAMARDVRSDYWRTSQALQELEDKGDAVIYSSPADTSIFQDFYKGALPGYGLGGGMGPSQERQVLLGLVSHFQRLWLVGGMEAIQGLRGKLTDLAVPVTQYNQGEIQLALFVPPADCPAPSPLGARFAGGKIILLSYCLAPGKSSPGQVVQLELNWLAGGSISEDYKAFVHLVDGSGHLWSQKDGMPDQWRRPTSGWHPGEQIRDRYALLLPPGIPPGEYSIVVGLYHPVNGRRLLVDGGDSLLVSAVQVGR